jgi:hypothetical protein
VIVNNAGYGLFGAAEELSDQQILEQNNTNLVGPIQVIRAALPHLREQGGGRIIQLSTYGMARHRPVDLSGPAALSCVSRPPARSDLRKAEERRHRALRLVARGEPEFLAGFGKPGQRKRRDSKVPGVHRSYRVLAHELERCVFDLILRCAEHRDRSVWRQVRVQQRQQPLGVPPT